MSKEKNRKRIISVVIAITLLVSVFIIPQSSVQAAADYNYGEALQKSILFYELQRSGKLPENKRDNWRGDSCLTDGAEYGVDLSGGWYDAGDHVKFTFPISYTVSMMGWSVYESKDAYVKSGQLPYILDNIKWATDYIMKCHTAPNVLYYQVADGKTDHDYWGPVEVYPLKRPCFKLDTANPGSTVAGEAAAALAIASIIFKESDPTYSATCLRHAKELLTFGDSTKSDKGYTASDGFYTSFSGFYDELTWASVWLYLATNDEAYLAKAESYEPNWEREPLSTTLKYKWAQCWDQKIFGAELLLARITNKSIYKEAIERHLDWWTVGVNGEKIKYTPKGLAWLDKWGSLRYATTEAFLATIYTNWSGADSAKAATYEKFAKSQVDYALGSTGRSYEIGFGVNPPKRPHHRTAHGSYMGYLDCDIPNYHRHVLVGALVGGPAADDSYTDDVKNYENNEVACDYNAGFVAVLSQMYKRYGGTPLANCNAIEKPVDDEYGVAANANSYGSKGGVSIDLTFANMTAWPARMPEKLTCRYYVDLSEVIAAGVNPDDITTQLSTNTNITLSKMKPWGDPSNHIYYIEADYSAAKVCPAGVNVYKKTITFKISLPAGKEAWDNENDFSYKGLIGGDWQGAPTKRIPVYENGVKVYGEEPPGGPVVSASPSKTTPPPSNTPVPSASSTSPNMDGFTISGYVKPDFNFTNNAADLKAGFKVEIEGGSNSCITDSNGYFELKDVPESSRTGYTLKISKVGYLARKVLNVVVGDNIEVSTEASPILMWAGDLPVNGKQDDAINIADIMELIKSFNTASESSKYVSTSDINKDNAVNINDVMIVAGHFNKAVSDY